MARPTGSIVAAGGALFRGLPGLAPTFLIVAMLACVLVPLPTALVDLLLSVSLAGSVLLLVASLGIGRTTEFLTFPSLLLLATLYRLALNVSTTRLILSQAYAGRVIDTFAGFVVRGDLIVGGVMFLIITVVQYVVIARGAERVAEVAARFALDGLPGHQAAIDADLRAGVISAHEAAQRRARLAERSSFYGAMDGAVRFVKGDAVAGLAITAVNLLGGLAIGMGRMGYSWQQSLEVYGRLTVGDGLLAQIPALLVSLAAGVLVSRVDREGDLPTAAWLQPPMLIVPATMLLVLAAIPQMPHLAFATTATALLTAAVVLSSRGVRATARRAETASPRRISVIVAPADVEERSSVERALAEVQAQCGAALNVEVPDIGLVVDPTHAPGALEVRFEDRRCTVAGLRSGRDGEDDIVLATYRAVMDEAPALVDLQDLDRMIERVRASHSVVVRQALANVELVDVLAVVRGFLRERLPLPPLHRILGVLAEGRRFRDRSEHSMFPELVRQRLVGYWLPPLLDAVQRLGRPVYLRPDPEAEAILLDHAIRTEEGPSLTLGAGERETWLDAVRALAAPTERETGGGGEGEEGREEDESSTIAAGSRRPLVLVATPAARPLVAELVAPMIPHVPVVSTAELAAAGVRADPRWLAPP